MALQPCEECQAQISARAKTCPHCGVKVKQRPSKGCLIGGVFFALAFWLIILAVFTSERDQKAEKEQTFVDNQTSSISPQVLSQLHNPTSCAASDVDCVQTAYAEYKAGILAELDDYRDLEDQVGGALSNHDDMVGNRIAGILMQRGLYRHLKWTFPTNEQMASTKIPLAEWDSIWSDCRAAIINMKWLIVSIAGGHDGSDDKRDYLESVRKCEKKFKLRPVRSVLRNQP